MREQQPAVAEPAARAVVAGPSPVSQAQAQVLMLQRHAGDRCDRLDPGNAASSPAGVLQKINPAAPQFTKYPCTQNCPAAASAAQAYLLSGAIPSSACSPLNEPKGYEISPGPESW